MPSNEMPAVGTPEYYEFIRKSIIDMAGSAGIPVTIGEDGSPKMDKRQDFTPPMTADRYTLAEDPYAPTAWGLPSEEDFTCPSGQVCLVRRVDIMDLLGEGLLNSVDFLTDVVRNEHIPNATASPAQRDAIAQKASDSVTSDPKGLASFAKSVDGVVIRVVAKPELHPVPPEGAARVNGRVYIDSVSTSDKFAIFNFVVSGKKEAEKITQFREETSESVGAVESVPDVRHETVNLPRDDGNATA